MKKNEQNTKMNQFNKQQINRITKFNSNSVYCEKIQYYLLFPFEKEFLCELLKSSRFFQQKT